MNNNRPDHVEQLNQRSLETLSRAIRLSQGEFSLILARCNYISLRNSMIARLQETFADQVQIIHLPETAKTLFTEIQKQLKQKPQRSVQPDTQPIQATSSNTPIQPSTVQSKAAAAPSFSSLHIFGLESLQSTDQVLVSTNQVRDEFPKHLRCPVVLWVNDWVLQRLSRLAPDFKSWASVVEFELAIADLIDALLDHTNRRFAVILDTGDDQFPSNWVFTPPANSLRRTEVEFAINRIVSSGKPLEPSLRANLNFLLGQEAHSHGELTTAQQHYESSLKYWLEQAETKGPQHNKPHPAAHPLSPSAPHPTPPPLPSYPLYSLTPHPSPYTERAACVLVYLGLLHRAYAVLQRVTYRAECERALGYFRHSLGLFEQINRQDLVAKFIIPEAEVLQKLERWDELETIARQAVVLHKLYKDLVRQARDHGFLAEVAIAREDWSNARVEVEAALRTLATAEDAIADHDHPHPFLESSLEIAQRFHYGWYRLLLARAEAGLGHMEQAIAHLEHARDQSFPRNDPQLYIRILHTLQDFYYNLKRYLDAFHTKQLRRSIEQQYGFRAFVGALRLQPPPYLFNYPDAMDQEALLTQEIAASGRQQDVKRLSDRLARNDIKLTVIHGPSGVGKSSIVIAGLIPSIKEGFIGELTPHPIIFDRYKDWQTSLSTLLTSNRTAIPLTSQPFDPPQEPDTPTFRDSISNVPGPDLESLVPKPELLDQTSERLTSNAEVPVLSSEFLTSSAAVSVPSSESQALNSELSDQSLEVPTSNAEVSASSLEFQALNPKLPSQTPINPPQSSTPPPPAAAAAPLSSLLSPLIAQSKLPILIFDQFEEFFFVCETFAQRRPFYEFLRDCLNQDYVKVILCLREDYLHYLLEFQRFVTVTTPNRAPLDSIVDILGKDVRYPLDDLTPADARAVIDSLTARAQYYLEPELVDALVKDLTNDQGRVRPIELQVVGAELQAEGINTLEEYRRAGTKEILVAHSLETVVHDCGTENEELARVVLFLLTHENGTRPLKTRDDLEADLVDLGMTHEIDKLDLVLEVVVGSGLVFEIPETPDKLYQLVHDYLVSFIQEQYKSALVEELERERELRRKREEELRQTVEQLERALENEEFLSDSLSAEALLTSNLDLEALVQAVSAGKRLQRSLRASPTTKIRVIAALRQVVYSIHELNRLEGHKASVLSVSFSPDGTMIASGSEDGTIKLWNLNGQVCQTLRGHVGSVRSVSFSPDSQMVISGSEDSTIKLWNLNGHELHTFKGHIGSVLSVGFSPDGERVVSGSDDKTIKLWSLGGRELHTLRGHRGWVWSVAFSPDGKTIASGSADHTIKLWRLDQGGAVASGWEPQTLSEHSGSVWSVCFSPDGKTLASGSADHTIKIWDLESPFLEQALHTCEGHSGSILSVSFSPDGQAIASSSADKTIKVWSRDGQELHTLRGHSDWVLSVNFSRDGKILASGGEESAIKLWNLQRQQLQTLKGHQGWVLSVSFGPNGDAIASGSVDKTIRLWNLDGQNLQTLSGHTGSVRSLSFSSSGRILSSGSDDSTIKLWTFNPAGAPIGQALKTLQGHTGSVWSVSFSPDGKLLASGSDDSTIKLWSLNGSVSAPEFGRELQTLRGHAGSVWSVCFSPDGGAIASSSADHTIKLWKLDQNPNSLQPGHELKTLRGHTGWVWSVSFSPDGKIIASGSDDKTIKLWSLDGRELQTLKGHSGSVWSVSFSPDGKTIVSSSDDNTIKLWSLDGRELQTLKGHSGSILSVGFSPNGTTIASGSDDTTIKLWNFDLDDLLAQGCNWLHDYLKTNPNLSEQDRKLCNGI